MTADPYLRKAQDAAKANAGVQASPRRFAEHLAARLPDPAALEKTAVDDLFLAWACLEGDATAIAALDGKIVRCVRSAAPALTPDARAEIEQAVRQRLLVGERRGGGRLAAYTGKGALGAWIKVVAVSITIDTARRQRPEQRADRQEGTDGLLQIASADLGAETGLLEAQHKQHFNAAFKEALASLTAEQRTMMRLRFVDNLDYEEVGKTFGVHRTTAMRSLEKAQALVLERTRGVLGGRLGLRGSKLESLMRALKPSLHDRISRVLSPIK